MILDLPEPNHTRMNAYRYARLQSELRRADCAAAVLCNAVNVRYATGTGYAQAVNMHSPFRAVFVPAEGKAIMYDPEMYSFGEKPEIVAEYRGSHGSPYFVAGEANASFIQKWAAELAGSITGLDVGTTRVAIDLSEPLLALALSERGIDVIN
ncbi:MAG: aminopeptidase P family N-terminal domain-containing protein, partial [Pseudomonadota bacterium]